MPQKYQIAMLFNRQKYLDRLVNSCGNGLVKIISGCRRSGKSFLLFNIFHNYLIRTGVQPSHIIELSFEDRRNKQLRDPDALLDFIDSQIENDGSKTFVILDEIQLVSDFVEVILSLLHNPILEIFVSGSNSRFLSSDIVTEFRGRGDEIRVWPLSFAEYFETIGGDRSTAWKNYYAFGGLPQVALLPDSERKMEFLTSLYELTFLRDIVERNNLRSETSLRQLVRILSSSIGSSTNVRRICNTFKSAENVSIAPETAKKYIEHLQDAFLIEEALRYDVKGRKYIGTESKFYFSDLGIRSAAINFRQLEENHIMENVIYNELRLRGFRVDVGLVTSWRRTDDNQSQRLNLEVDFVANKGDQRFYIQSAFAIPDDNKRNQELASLKNINDTFKRILILRDDITPYHDDNGFLVIGLLDFLLNSNALS